MRKYKLFQNITAGPTIKFGKPVIEGTRVPVELVVGKIGGGMTIDEVMKEYQLTRQQVLAALQYAAHLVAGEKVAIV